MRYLKLYSICLALFVSNNCIAQRGSSGSLFNGINDGNRNEIINGVIDGVLEVIPGIIDGSNTADDIPTLSPTECDPHFEADANLAITFCTSNECIDCYEDATYKMDFFRMQLGRLNCIYQNTKKYTDAKVAFGDGASGIHTMTALTWQRQRSIIMASFAQLQQTYDRKYVEFIEGLQAALMQFDRCENMHGTQDWYAKFGFMYYDMIKERYKRTD
jgi:hypothetical protein